VPISQVNLVVAAVPDPWTHGPPWPTTRHQLEATSGDCHTITTVAPSTECSCIYYQLSPLLIIMSQFNLLLEIRPTMVRDNLLTLTVWFARGDIEYIMFSMCDS